MAAARKKSSPKTTGSAAAQGPQPSAKELQAAAKKKRAAKSAAKGGRKSAQAKSSSSRDARPTNPDSMSQDVIDLITAIDEYKRKHQRPFPSWSEILDIVKGLGYSKAA